ncbi:hypothetical protein LMG31886_21400 [Xanthomonas hydrangeae]|nr:hypothetical protein LMG31884_21960 [Xanthomonas hydrangeae]CAD7716509.1 hypothetical protein LMG31884_21960 [Xanthomonas hydrangeae]CAD7731868.1 hypothetical protein LMG31887_21950 [Xanthomonas hydrangeae]CAD7731871.1 hypothetical protein LMG31887_21950 [Xanthomonas hydrangeae]CAD7734370.1 hypothetical protein LMG31886_20660 [Xanthomonas hydrangeae]
MPSQRTRSTSSLPTYSRCNAHWLFDASTDLLVDRNVFLRFQRDSESLRNNGIEVGSSVLLAGNADSQGLPVLEGLNLFFSFQHFMLYGATLNLIVVSVLTVQLENLTGPVFPAWLQYQFGFTEVAMVRIDRR